MNKHPIKLDGTSFDFRHVFSDSATAPALRFPKAGTVVLRRTTIASARPALRSLGLTKGSGLVIVIVQAHPDRNSTQPESGPKANADGTQWILLDAIDCLIKHVLRGVAPLFNGAPG